MDISIYQGASSIVLNGAGISSPLKAARFAGAELSQLELVLEGTAAQIAASVSALRAWLTEAARVDGEAGEDWVYLRVVLPDGSAWRSLLRGGEVRPVHNPAARKVSAETLILALVRAPWWESDTLAAITLTNQHSNGVNGFTYNHDDGNSDNWVTLSAIGGDLPAPVILTDAAGAVANFEAYMGISVYSNLAALVMSFEGESASSGAGVTAGPAADAGCSNGNYNGLSWNGTALVRLAYWSPGQATISAFAGRFFLPVVRLRTLLTGGERFWCQVSLWYDATGTFESLYETEPVLLPTDKLLIPLPSLQLPPWPTHNADSQPVVIMLTVFAEGAGAHALQLDCINFIPMDSYLHLIPKVTSFPNFNIVYDTEKGLLKNDSRSMGTHIAEGGGLWVTPGRVNRFYMLGRTGTTSAIGMANQLNISYRARRKTL